MEQALGRLQDEFQRDGKATQFQQLKVFVSREAGDGEYAAIAAASNSTAGAVGVAVHRLRQRFGQLVRREVADTVARPPEVEEELRYLFAVLMTPH
jgi:RNA polymerase sigma-70 factor (ECF subfamily)